MVISTKKGNSSNTKNIRNEKTKNNYITTTEKEYGKDIIRRENERESERKTYEKEESMQELRKKQNTTKISKIWRTKN